jgi:hypothetical protein
VEQIIMKMAVVFVGATPAGAALIATDAGASNLVTNGDFDNIGSVWVNNTGLGSDDWQTARATAIPDWTNVTGYANEFWVGASNGYSGLTASLGNGSQYFVDLTAQANHLPFGELEQTITTTAGDRYILTFALGASAMWNPGSDPLAKSALTASAMGTSLLASQLFTASIPTTNNQWMTETLYFIANSSSTTIEFLGDSNYSDAKYIGLDNVNVSAVTPLPAALPLFATGLGAMGLLGWRRKRKNAAVIAAA